MNVSIPLEDILKALSGLSLSNRIWLAEHLVKPEERNEAKILKKDEDFMREFLSMPYENPITTEQAKQQIRESRQFGLREINYQIENEIHS